MPYTEQEQANLDTVNDALKAAEANFPSFFDAIFSADVEWTIAGHGPVARTYAGMKDLYDNAEEALYSRFAEPLKITTIGTWADGDQVFARIKSRTQAVDGEPYANEYMYIMTVKDGRVVSGIEWLDLNAYYGILERVRL
jgi:ketosteroid isomerase-like protein